MVLALDSQCKEFKGVTALTLIGVWHSTSTKLDGLALSESGWRDRTAIKCE